MPDCGGSGKLTRELEVPYLGMKGLVEKCNGCSHPGCPARPREGEAVSDTTPEEEIEAKKVLELAIRLRDLEGIKSGAFIIAQELKYAEERGFAQGRKEVKEADNGLR